MLKIRGTNGKGQPVIIIGLSARNVELLTDGRPIAFDLSEIGLEGNVVIFAGNTEAEMLDDLKRAGMIHGAEIHSGNPPAGDIRRKN